MARRKLLDHHPTMVKFQKLMDHADELGISLSTDGWGNWQMTDEAFENVTFNIQDVDGDNPVETFPPTLEFKITYEKP